MAAEAWKKREICSLCRDLNQEIPVTQTVTILTELSQLRSLTIKLRGKLVPVYFIYGKVVVKLHSFLVFAPVSPMYLLK